MDVKKQMPTALLTGATGFIGNALLTKLVAKQYKLIAPSRSPLDELPHNVTMPLLNDLGSLSDNTDWFTDCDVVIHIAAKAHSVNVTLEQYRQTNTRATLQLANIAAAAGVKRFIFLSSIGVNGLNSTIPFKVEDQVAPIEDYALSKLEAEIGLRKISAQTGMEVVIIRPPLVYGPNAPGNFGKLIKLTQQNFPLPLGMINNKRSLVALDNLVDLIVTCIEHPKAANQTFLVSDDRDVSTTELLKLMIQETSKAPWLIPVPMSCLKLAGKLIGKQSIIDRLCGNLQVDITHTKETLGWTPPFSIEEGIKRCFKRY